MQDKLQDTAIITMVLSGQQQAYALLVERYQQFVFTLTMRYVHNREQAEELAQDVFVKAYRSLGDFKGNSKFSTWLYTIVHYTCLSALRKKQDLVVFVEDISLLENHAQVTNTLTGFNTKATKALLAKAIDRLPTGDAEIVTLFYQGEQSVEEIGIITGQTPGNVKVRLHRARQKLKQIIMQHYPAEYRELEKP